MGGLFVEMIEHLFLFLFLWLTPDDADFFLSWQGVAKHVHSGLHVLQFFQSGLGFRSYTVLPIHGFLSFLSGKDHRFALEINALNNAPVFLGLALCLGHRPEAGKNQHQPHKEVAGRNQSNFHKMQTIKG